MSKFTVGNYNLLLIDSISKQTQQLQHLQNETTTLIIDTCKSTATIRTFNTPIRITTITLFIILLIQSQLSLIHPHPHSYDHMAQQNNNQHPPNKIQETWEKDKYYFIKDRIIRYDTNNRDKIINTFNEYSDFISIINNPYDKTEEDLYEIELIIHTKHKHFISQNGFPQILRDEAELDQGTRQTICFNLSGVKKEGGHHMKFGKIIWQFAINEQEESKLIKVIQLVNEYIIRNKKLQKYLATGTRQKKTKMHWGTYDHKKYPFKYILIGLDLGFNSTDIKEKKSLKLITKTLLKNIPKIKATDITWRAQFNTTTNRFNTREIRIFSLIKFELIPNGERKIKLQRWWIEGVQINYNMTLKLTGYVKTEPDKEALYNNDYIKTQFESDLEKNIYHSLFNTINNISYTHNIYAAPIFEVQYELDKINACVNINDLIEYVNNYQTGAWSVIENRIQFNVVIKHLNNNNDNGDSDILMSQNNNQTKQRQHINQTLHRLNTITGASSNPQSRHQQK